MSHGSGDKGKQMYMPLHYFWWNVLCEQQKWIDPKHLEEGLKIR